MSNIKIVVRKKPNKKGDFPICLRITSNRKTSYVYLNEYIQPDLWDEKNSCVKKKHPNSVRLNNYLFKKLSEAKDKLLEEESKNAPSSILQLKTKISSKRMKTSFFEFADEYFKTMYDEGNFNRHTAEITSINHFRRFTQNNNLDFIDITYNLLEKFRAYLKGTVKTGERTTANYLMVIRTIYNRAIKNKIIDRTYYPFGDDGMKIKIPESLKIGLELDQIIQLENTNYHEQDYKFHAKNFYLFSFYFAGMRVSDVLLLRWCDVNNNRLHYIMGKNNKPGSVKIPSKAENILNYYRQYQTSINDHIFLEMKNYEPTNDKVLLQRRLKIKIDKINEHLKLIGLELEFQAPLTMHISRHSFANISGDSIPIQRLQQLYRHTSISTTIGYQKAFLNKDTDEALDKVLNY